MKTTINLRFDKNTIEAAKAYASKKQTSVSAIIEAYLKKLIAQDRKEDFASDNLIGILKQYKDLSDEELKAIYLKDKHNA
ncbi:hypothetical protein FW774_14870 [Pedobacter sp. BS3]|uniref:DUF6364 family protein n=1 Tax=Pedobacter sp. BS3 TaxID=2567937 RepID=UPI0011ECA645|nr:DUF6364 family protein [Pedobacter sp. BS3]TZF82771.1 hypothetical protein FW774_14870 [Pedobacter sp. BS3]